MSELDQESRELLREKVRDEFDELERDRRRRELYGEEEINE
jgi:hypothetical protein